MNYITHNQDPTLDINMTGLMGYCYNLTRYNDIVAVFGEPTTGDEYKVDAEWIIKFDDGLIATIYNYKTGKNYLGKQGLSVEFLSGDSWHIGGRDKVVVDRVNSLLKSHIEKSYTKGMGFTEQQTA